MIYDDIIIGGGLGGLTVASFLSKARRKVLLIEKNPNCGGCIVEYKRKDFKFDSSTHWINNAKMIKGFLSELDAEDYVEFKKFDPMMKIITNNDKYLLTFDVEKFKNKLIENFPDDKENILLFFSDAKAFGDDMELLMSSSFKYMRAKDFVKFGMNYVTNKLSYIRKYSGKKACDVIEPMFKSKELKNILYSLGTVPNCSIYPVLCKIAWAYSQNYYYITKENGKDNLSEALEKISINNGTQIINNSEVIKIIVNDKKAVGVECKDGTVYKGRNIISDIDANTTYFKLIGEKYFSEKFINTMKSKKIYPSYCRISLGVDYDFSKMGYNGETVTLLPSDDMDELFGYDLKYNRKSLYFRSLHDKSYAPENLSTLEIGFRLPYNYMNYWKTDSNRNRTEQYYDLKKEVVEEVLNSVSKIFPDIRDHILLTDLITPITYERYTGNKEGSMMGWEEGKGGILRKEPLKNLYRVGHWSFPGGGIPRVMASGKIVSDIIISRDKK